MRAIYPVLFRAYVEKFNWGYMDYYPETGLLQSFFGYLLYLFTLYGNEWRESTFYEDAFLRAFPSLLDTVKPKPRRHRAWDVFVPVHQEVRRIRRTGRDRREFQ